ncbi:DENN domain-containing protein 11-like [Bolinopsis microptera]|uniref:DENN domain-containing protein 11-like n=1 Tax=Bolinopsis microptera TaxID=2820187 RepID=UPI00307AAFDD
MQCSDESEPLLTLQERSDLINAEFTPPFVSCDPKLLSVFVVAFDTRAGNVVEWKYPESYSLTGVEFKALPSGAHNVQHDVMIFELANNFGLAAYIMKQVDNTAERGARMKSVGVITSNYLALCQHEERLVELAHDSVEHPGAYEQLIQYFAEFNQGCSVPVSLEMKANSVGSMYDLFKSQGVQIFTLWKMLLLKKRILLQCTPPISRQCSYVICLAAICHSQFTQSNPLFYVTVNDMTTLNYKQSYIACSADMILKTKGSQVYDVYVTGSAVVDPKGEMFPVTRGDIIRYNQLCGAVDKEYGKKNTSEVDRLIQGYFSVLTTDLFNTLTNLMTGSRGLQPDDLKDIRLHNSDLPYLQTLVDKLGYDVELFSPSCCEEHFSSLI